MKANLKNVLFALVLSACGGDRETPNRASSANDNGSSVSWFSPQTIASSSRDAGVVESPSVVADAASVSTQLADHELKSPSTFDDTLTQGRALATKGEQAAAREMFEAAIQLDPHRAEPHVELSRSYIATGDKALAIAAAKKAIKLAPDSTTAWNTMGRAELARFDYDSAIVAFTKATELNKANVWAWNNLGFTQLTLKKYDDAVVALTQATSLPGATAYMFNNLGTALEQLDKLDEARDAYERGGKLGSKEALASRHRLDGVRSIAMAKIDTRPLVGKDGKLDLKVDGERKAPAASGKTYELNEGQLDEDKALGSDVAPVESGSGSGVVDEKK